MNPKRTLFVCRDMLFAQIVRIGESQPSQAAETEDIPDSVEPVVGHRTFQQHVQFFLR